MTRRAFASVAIAGVLGMAAAAAAQPANPCAAKNPVKPASPCAAKNPCAGKSPSAAPRSPAIRPSVAPSNFASTGTSPMRDLPVNRTGEIILAP